MNSASIHLLDDIYSGLSAGLRSSEALLTHNLSSEGYRVTRTRRDDCQRGLNALDMLRGQLRDGKLHVEPSPDWKPDSCYCAATSHPPCSFCVS